MTYILFGKDITVTLSGVDRRRIAELKDKVSEVETDEEALLYALRKAVPHPALKIPQGAMIGQVRIPESVFKVEGIKPGPAPADRDDGSRKPLMDLLVGKKGSFRRGGGGGGPGTAGGR